MPCIPSRPTPGFDLPLGLPLGHRVVVVTPPVAGPRFLFGRIRRLLLLAAVVSVSLAAAPARGQFDLDVERDLLIELMRDGKYRQALAETKRVERAIEPTADQANDAEKKGPAKQGRRPSKQPQRATGPMARVLVELLTYRGTIERRMGNLDAADKTLTEAFQRFMDPEFQRFIAQSAPTADLKRSEYFLGLELTFLQMLDNGTELLIERVRDFNHAKQAGQLSAEQERERRPEVEGWFKKIDEIIHMSMAKRRNLIGQFTAGDPRARSPQFQMMATLARPYRLTGMRYLEASQLPWTLSFDADPAEAEEDADGERAAAKPTPSPPPTASRADGQTTADKPAAEAIGTVAEETVDERLAHAESQRRRGLSYLKKSRDMAAASIEAARAAPGNEAVARSADDPSGPAHVFRQESARIGAETLVPMSILAMIENDLEGSRKNIDEALAGLRTAESEGHPELARPLIVSAELALKESRESLAKKDARKALQQSKLAVDSLRDAKKLLESKDSEFDPSAPLHAVLADLLTASEEEQTKSTQIVTASDASDAAARKALAAISRAEAAKNAKKPKPNAAEPAKPKTAGEKAAGEKAAGQNTAGQNTDKK